MEENNRKIEEAQRKLAEERLAMVEEQRRIDEERHRLQREQEKQVKEEQMKILNKGKVRPKLSFSLKPVSWDNRALATRIAQLLQFATLAFCHH